MGLSIYKAGAGTGKTYRLALTYLTQLLRGEHFNPQNGAHLLAVTFTNKATNEMKSRILGQLSELAKGVSSPMSRSLKETTGLDEPTLFDRAKRMQTYLLHHFSDFSITTLDAFFLRVIRAFAEELGMGGGYTIDLDQQRLLDRMTVQVIDNVTLNPSLRRWLRDLISRRVEQGQSWQLDTLLKEVGQEISKEALLQLGEPFLDKWKDKDFLNDYIALLDQQINSFEEAMAAYGHKAMELLAESGFSFNDFPYKNTSFLTYFQKIAARKPALKDFIPLARPWQVYEGHLDLLHGKNPSLALKAFALGILRPHLVVTIDFYLHHFTTYATARLLRAELAQMGLLADVLGAMRQLRSQHRTLSTNDATYLLSQLVGNGNAPFVYERIGARFHSFLLDEFQDTSTLQWHNMRPLVLDGLACGAESLIVGDVKQSIYRWRNSQWRLLGQEVEQDKELAVFGITTEALTINRRSRAAVLEYINTTMERAVEVFNQKVASQVNATYALEAEQKTYLTTLIDQAYQQCALEPAPQATALGAEPGYVQVVPLVQGDLTAARAEALERTRELMASLQDRGFRPQEVLVLVRTNREARLLTTYLLAYRQLHPEDPHVYEVLSSDSLTLKASAHVCLIVAYLKAALYPQDAINLQLIEQLSRQCEAPVVHQDQDFMAQLQVAPLANALELIVQRLRWQTKGEALPYIQELHDVLLDFQGREAAGLYSFVTWWDEGGKDTPLTSEVEGQAFRVLTIHTAKGLEAPVVILPFANWEIVKGSGGYKSLLWTGTSKAPFNAFPVMPVPFKEELMYTVFAYDYLYEYTQRAMDSLNVLYVALTRAGSELYVLVPQKEEKKGKDSPSVSMIASVLEAKEVGAPLTAAAIAALHAKTQPVAAYALDTYPSAPYASILAPAYQEEPFTFSPEDSLRQWGIVLHKALSLIETKAQIPRVMEELVCLGEVEGHTEAVARYTQMLERTLQTPPVAQWFDGTWQVRNEAALLSAQGMLRPDRVMEKDGLVVIVDYKFGQPRPSHLSQVARYAQWLQRMGHPRVEGYVLYFRLDAQNAVLAPQVKRVV